MWRFKRGRGGEEVMEEVEEGVVEEEDLMKHQSSCNLTVCEYTNTLDTFNQLNLCYVYLDKILDDT